MPYFPVDDDVAFHPKILAAGNEAVGMWTRAGALCKKHTTGGHVSVDTARALGSKKLADRLVAVGLWVEVPGGYQFHDWTKQAGNDEAHVEKERAERAREKNAARQAAWRERHAGRNGVTNAGDNPPVTKSPSPSPMTDFFSPSESQSRDTRANVSTDAMDVPEVTRQMAARKGITSLRTVADAIQRHTGVRVDATGAYQVAASLLDRAKDHPKAPARYVSAAIAQSPLEVQQFIHEHALEVAS